VPITPHLVGCHPLWVFSDQRQPSRGKLDHLQCTTAESTLCIFDGYGLRNLALARPTLTPLIRFLFIGSHFCSTLPSDLASRQRPSALLSFTSIRLATDFHPQVVEHARHTLLHCAPLALLVSQEEFFSELLAPHSTPFLTVGLPPRARLWHRILQPKPNMLKTLLIWNLTTSFLAQCDASRFPSLGPNHAGS
jgi:hypothetical protein